MRSLVRWSSLVLAGLALTLAASTAVSASTRATSSAQSQKSGGSLTVLEPSATTGSWTTLDPAYDTVAAENYDQLNSIFGELFEEGAKGAIVPDLATSYKLTHDDETLTIQIRKGVKFTDGTAFNAQAVAYNINRDLTPSIACHCLENFPTVTSTTATGPYTVVLQSSKPDPSLAFAFIAEAPDWIASPTALESESEAAFGQHPVGAGPFEVVSNTPSASLVLTKNPHYWEPGHPLLSSLTFETVSSDQTALAAMQSGEGQVYMSTTTVQTVTQAKSDHFRVYLQPATDVADIPLNPTIPPFNNPVARQAIYYATNASLIDKQIFGGVDPETESPTGPGDLYYEPKVPGYRSYNLAKAKALVSQLGGLSFTLASLNAPIDVEVDEALYEEWSAAGIKVTIAPYQLAQIVVQTEHNSLQAIYSGVGSYDPALIPGVSFFFSSTGPFSMVRDSALDALINQANLTESSGNASTLYHRVFKYISDQAYAPMLFAEDTFDIANSSVKGLASLSEIPWENVAR